MVDYWEITPNQFKKCVQAYQEEDKRRQTMQDTNNWNLGKYIAYAFNKPASYPKKPFLYEEERKVLTAEEMERRMRRNTIILGGKIK